MTLINRLRAHVARPVTMAVTGAGDLSGVLQRVGADWLLLATTDEAIVPLAAVIAVLDLPPRAVSDDGVSVVTSGLRLTSVLRAVARDRSAVTVIRRDGHAMVGTPDRVGADFVDIALHELGEAPRRQQVRSRATVSFDAIGCVRRRPSGWD